MAERPVMRVVARKHVFSDGCTNVVFFFVATSGRIVQCVGRTSPSSAAYSLFPQGIADIKNEYYLSISKPRNRFREEKSTKPVTPP